MPLGLAPFPSYHASALLWSVTLCKERDTSTVHGVTELRREAERCGTMARAAHTAWAPQTIQYWARKDTGEEQEHPFSARIAPLKSGSPLMTFQGVLAKNTNQAPLSKLDNRRGNSFVDYIKKRETISWMKEKKNLLGRKAATASSSLSELTLLERVQGRDVKPSPASTYSFCLNEGDRGAKIFQGKVFCRCKLAYQ